MNSVSVQAIEEAANIATEFIYSLDNLPNEVRHMCEEIKYLDSKAFDIQSAIESECQRYIDMSRQPSGIPPNYKGPNQARIAAAFTEIHKLNTEKMMLSQQMITLILRTRARLDVDIGKVRRLQGEPPLNEVHTRSSIAQTGNTTGGFAFSNNAAMEMTESLRSVMLPPTPAPVEEARRQSPAAVAQPTATTPAGATTKKRRLAASTPSIKLPAARSMSPVVPPKPAPPPQRPSRLSRQVHPPQPPPEPVAPEPDEPEEVEGEDEDGDDDKPYCFCQKKSFGDMIACDGPNCPYEWFHLSCVGLKTNQLNEDASWYCDVCKTKMAGQTNGRRRRK
ncbi:hypothetical protein BDZ89DRAFT_1014947 [Hymenopellis radicata]|nr:hypothetical protein BDZ89DRAFT_1014947 [Hymenopellis radicata]